MIPVDQSIVDGEKGDCTRAAIASLLDLDITQVPNFRLYNDEQWFDVLWYFLISLGFQFKEIASLSTHSNPANYDNIHGYVIASVASKTFKEKTHSVIMDITGIVAHDPNPNKAWQGINIIKSSDLIDWWIIGRSEK